MTTCYYDIMPSPVGDLLLVVNDRGDLTQLYTGRSVAPRTEGVQGARNAERLAAVRKQMGEYFAGTRTVFDLTIAPEGSDFQQQVWASLMQIPFGETRAYGQLAAELGVPDAARAVGRANATNPISIVVPCHRVIGASGALTGYGGGLPVKKWLLEFEGAIPRTNQQQFEL